MHEFYTYRFIIFSLRVVYNNDVVLILITNCSLVSDQGFRSHSLKPSQNLVKTNVLKIVMR